MSDPTAFGFAPSKHPYQSAEWWDDQKGLSPEALEEATRAADGAGQEQAAEDRRLSEMEKLEAEVFSASPTLEHVRRAARSRMVSPWAVLGSLLAVTSAEVGPEVTLPPTIGGVASLNFSVGLVGPSGMGKSAAHTVALELFGPTQAKPIGPGSGEGIVQSFLVWNAKAQEHTLRQPPHSLLYADEIGRVGAVQERNASTFSSVIRSMWSGADATTTNAEARRNRDLRAHTYRLAIVAGIQPDLSGILLDDSDAGTPQRWLWMPATDPFMPEDEDMPTWPGSLDVAEDWNVLGQRPEKVELAESVARFVRDQHRAKVRGSTDTLDAHAVLTRLKVAALLAFLHDESTVDERWWGLAEKVMEVSALTRGECVTTLRLAQNRKAEARGASNVRVRQAEARTVAEDNEKRARLLHSTVDRGDHANAKHGPEEGCTRRCLTFALRAHKDCDRDAVIATALDLDWIEERDGRYFRGGSRPA